VSSQGLRQTLALSLGSLAVFAALAVRVTADEIPWLDTHVIRLVPPGNEPNSLSRVCEAFVAAGMVLGAIFVVVAVLWLIRRRDWKAALFWFSTFAGVAVLEVALKPIFERPPIGDSSDGYSFPSGSAMASMAFLAAAATLVPRGHTRRRLLIGGTGLVSAYGAALVYMSWHYPTDVLGGWSLALVWVGSLTLAIGPRGVFEPQRLPGTAALTPPGLKRD
jgi:undecaprenyl-diphosphatase